VQGFLGSSQLNRSCLSGVSTGAASPTSVHQISLQADYYRLRVPAVPVLLCGCAASGPTCLHAAPHPSLGCSVETRQGDRGLAAGGAEMRLVGRPRRRSSPSRASRAWRSCSTSRCSRRRRCSRRSSRAGAACTRPWSWCTCGGCARACRGRPGRKLASAARQPAMHATEAVCGVPRMRLRASGLFACTQNSSSSTNLQACIPACDVGRPASAPSSAAAPCAPPPAHAPPRLRPPAP